MGILRDSSAPATCASRRQLVAPSRPSDRLRSVSYVNAQVEVKPTRRGVRAWNARPRRTRRRRGRRARRRRRRLPRTRGARATRRGPLRALTSSPASHAVCAARAMAAASSATARVAGSVSATNAAALFATIHVRQEARAAAVGVAIEPVRLIRLEVRRQDDVLAVGLGDLGRVDAARRTVPCLNPRERVQARRPQQLGAPTCIASAARAALVRDARAGAAPARPRRVRPPVAAQEARHLGHPLDLFHCVEAVRVRENVLHQLPIEAAEVGQLHYAIAMPIGSGQTSSPKHLHHETLGLQREVACKAATLRARRMTRPVALRS